MNTRTKNPRSFERGLFFVLKTGFDKQTVMCYIGKKDEVVFMLKGIPKILSPELLKVLCEMGHGDTLCIADGNFPTSAMGDDSIIIRMDGHGIPEILEAILEVCPLDHYVEKPVLLMKLLDRDVGRVETPIWDTYTEIVEKNDDRGEAAIEHVERFAFYDETRKCHCIIATGESAIYANIIIQKGIV